jgi:type I restriction enzyme S subunit
MPVVQRLDRVCEISMGQAPSGEAYNDEGSGWPLIAGAGDFGDLYPAPKKFTTEASRLSKAGDIILGIRATIGEKVESDGEYCLGRGVAGLRAKKDVDSRYLWHWLTHVRPILAAKGKGATFKQVNKEDIGELAISLPPLTEQIRIAAILDQADVLRVKRREALAQLDSLAQSIFIEMFGDPVTNPKGWVTKKLKEVTAFENGDRSGNYPSGDDIKTEGVLFLSTKNITDGRLDLSNSVYIDEQKFASLSRGKARRYDLIITLRGTLGSCCIFDCAHEKGFINAQMMIIRPGAECHHTYLHSLITSRHAQERLASLSRGAAVPQLTATQLADFPIPVPPMSDQIAFAKCKDSLDKLKVVQESARMELDALFASLQHRAFRGEL